MTEQPERRLLLVHAHPDDESINNGATMARYVAEGTRVTLVTCTLGEHGEVIPPGLGHLTGRALAEHRLGELTEAMRAVGVTDFRRLAGDGRYTDSGMTGTADNDDPTCLWQAGLDEAAGHLVDVIREVRPQVLVTYDPNGGYGHPDHIKAHRVAMRAAELAADPAFRPRAGGAEASGAAGEPWRIAKIYWNRVPRSVAETAFARLAEELPGLPFAKAAAVDDVPGVVDDALVTTEIDGTAYAAAKAAAMAAHATQIEVSGPWFVLSNELAQPVFPVEYYELAGGGGTASGARETDLFAGIAGIGGTGGTGGIGGIGEGGRNGEVSAR